MEYKYKAFISYDHVNCAEADIVESMITSFKVPNEFSRGGNRFTNTKVFRDKSTLSDPDLNQGIIEGLKDSEYLIVICTPDVLAKSSYNWVAKEIRLFMLYHAGIKGYNSQDNLDLLKDSDSPSFADLINKQSLALKRIIPIMSRGTSGLKKVSPFDCFLPELMKKVIGFELKGLPLEDEFNGERTKGHLLQTKCLLLSQLFDIQDPDYLKSIFTRNRKRTYFTIIAAIVLIALCAILVPQLTSKDEESSDVYINEMDFPESPQVVLSHTEESPEEKNVEKQTVEKQTALDIPLEEESIEVKSSPEWVSLERDTDGNRIFKGFDASGNRDAAINEAKNQIRQDFDLLVEDVVKELSASFDQSIVENFRNIAEESLESRIENSALQAEWTDENGAIWVYYSIQASDIQNILEEALQSAFN